MNVSDSDQIPCNHQHSDYKSINSKKLVTGLILAGGQSTRMGEDKAQVRVHNKELIEWAIENLSPQVHECWINTNHPERFKKWNQPIVMDQPPYQQQGPLSGIYAALKEIQTPWLALLPIDSPWLPLQFIERQLRKLSNIIDHTTPMQPQAILLKSGNGSGDKYIEPLFSLVHRNSLEKLEKYLSTPQKHSCYRFLLSIPHIITQWHDDFYFRYNLNTPSDVLTLNTQYSWNLQPLRH